MIKSSFLPKFLIVLFFLSFSLTAASEEKLKTEISDSYSSGMWQYYQRFLLGNPEKISFDDRVIVGGPDRVEDSFQVPVMIDASAIKNVEKVVVFVDYGPIPQILTYFPENAEPIFSFRFKIDQTTPVRAAVMNKSGEWFVGTKKIAAIGGGCTSPAFAYNDEDWSATLGRVESKVWTNKGRIKFQIDHPMDTGLADGIPVFIIENLSLQDNSGKKLGRFEIHQPVSEDPIFMVQLGPKKVEYPLLLKGRDNNGNLINQKIVAN